MEILVAGGTGFIGRHVVAALRRHYPEARVRIGTRHPRTPDAVRVDVLDPASLAAATRGVDVVVHTVQFPNHPNEQPWRGLTYERYDGLGTEQMVRAARENGVRRFVYLSGAGVTADRPEPWMRAKWRAEQAVVRSGMEYVILRPSWVYGPDDRTLNRFVSFVRYLPVVPQVGDGQTRVQPVLVTDVAEVVARAVTLPAAAGRVFELGGPEELTMDEVVRTVMEVLGRRRPILHHPKWLLKVLTWPLQFIPGAPLSPVAVDFVTQEARVDPGPAREVFGIQFTPLREGLSRYLP